MFKKYNSTHLVLIIINLIAFLLKKSILLKYHLFFFLQKPWKLPSPWQLNEKHIEYQIKSAFFTKKNLVWHSHNFLLPYTAVKEYFIISFTFIFNRYFLCFTVDKLRAFIGIVNNFRILLECGCIHLIRTTK